MSNTIERVNRIDARTWRYTALIIATFVIGLIVDRYSGGLYGGLAGQLAVSVWCWLLMFRLISESPAGWRRAFFACLAWASAGEIFLSLVWGLYTYRLGNIPFFIPPGHVFLLWLGVTFAPRLPRLFVPAVPAGAIAYAAVAAWRGFDTISIALVALFVLCWMQREGRRLYSLMLVMSLAVELYGTWLGNWVWHGEVPYFPLNSANPPLAAGSFYCMLDVLVGLTVRWSSGARNGEAVPVSPSRAGAAKS
ncbi:MAG: hypothetical protein PVH25_11530 [Burkholderiales bacterium]